MSQLKLLVKDISVYGISEFLNRSIQILFLPIIFAFLSTSEFGTLDLFLTTKNIIAAIFGWGMITAVQRYGGIKTEDDYRIEEVITSSFIMVLVIDIILGVVFYFVYALMIESDIFSFLLVLGISAFYSLRSIILGVLRLQHKARAFLLVTLLNMIIYLGGTFLLIKYTNLSYVAFLVAGFIGVTSSFLLGLYIIRGDLKICLHKKLLKSMFKFGASILSTSLIVIFVASSNRYMLGLFGSSIEEVGILGMSNRLSLFVGALLVAPFSLAWLPFVNDNYMNENFRSLVSMVVKAVVIIGVLLSAILIIVGYPILNILEKSSYINSMMIAPFFCLSYIFQAGYYIFSSSFYINEQNKLYVKSSLFVFMINMIMLAMIIPYTNYVTVSVVTMITYLGQMLFAYHFSNHSFKLKRSEILKIIFFIILCGSGIALVMYGHEHSIGVGLLTMISILVLLAMVVCIYIFFNKEFEFNKIIIDRFAKSQG